MRRRAVSSRSMAELRPQTGANFQGDWQPERIPSRPSHSRLKNLLQGGLVYSAAGAIVWYVARDVSWTHVARAASEADPWLFTAASLGSFICWFVGETVLYAYLFSSFHRRTSFLELVPTIAVVYFGQIVNSIVASAALVLFLRARKRVPWLTAGCTLMFQAYVDMMLLAMLSLVAIALVPTSPIRPGLDYAAGTFGALSLITIFWLLWQPRKGLGRWLYDRPAMVSFRRARVSHYLTLGAIRLAIFLAAGIALYGQFASFHLQVPLLQVLALTPFVIAVGNLPISPAGIGTTQLVFVLGFSHFATKPELLAVSLAASALNFLFRIPLGFFSFAAFAAKVSEVRHELPNPL
jgi:uncharacterized membrane protein YbhN (UPF0104 family)